MMIPTALLLAQSSTPGSASFFESPLAMMIPMVIIFYFLLIRPAQKQRKELEKRVSSLERGDQVVTTAGIHALVHNVKERTVVLRIAEGIMVEFDKTAVASIQKKEGGK